MNALTVSNMEPMKHVLIDTPVMEAWINSLAEIALTLRLRSRARVVNINPDRTRLEKSGSLTLLTTVNGEPVHMTVPDRTWRFASEP